MKMQQGNDTPFYCLKLSEPLKFDTVSRARLNTVFYDECNNQVFSVQTRGDMMEVIAKCPDKHLPRTFQIIEKGAVVSIKFNPAQTILAVQRTQSSVEFINFYASHNSPEYSQNCNNKTAKILGFIWMSAMEICFITDQGVELYQVESCTTRVRLSKSVAMNINWFLFCNRTGLLLLSSGALGSTMQPIYLKQGNLHKLNRFEIDSSSVLKSQKLLLEERDTMVGIIYEQPRVLVLRHQIQKSNHGAEVIIYTIQKMTTVKKSNILKLGRSGRFAMSIVDNLVFVHHQASKTSLMFDIGLDAEFDGCVYHHSPVMPPQPIKGDEDSELYSANWIVFPMNIVIDIKVGCLWNLELELTHIRKLIHSKVFLIEFIMLRTYAKDYILQILQDITKDTDQNLEEVATVFDKINEVYRSYLLMNVKWQLGSPVSSVEPPASDSLTLNRVVIDQSDMYTTVLSRLTDYVNEDSTPRQRRWASWVLLEYVRSLTDHQLPAQHYLLELVINSLILHKSYYQLHQLLQYYVISDSKPLACLLLSLQNFYPAARQLALDMLQRLSNAEQEIIEVLLSENQVLPALRYAVEAGNEEQISERKFTEVAQATGDTRLLLSVLAYFQTRKASANGPSSR